jgi:hypothetical protein
MQKPPEWRRRVVDGLISCACEILYEPRAWVQILPGDRTRILSDRLNPRVIEDLRKYG